MRKYLAVATTLLLVVLAFFLPALFSQWNDSQLLDEPHIVRDTEEREGFAESIQLTVAEKILLLRSGSLTPLPLGDKDEPEIRVALVEGETVIYESEEPTVPNAAAGTDGSVSQEWANRLERVQSEIRTLQSMGALPSLWSWSDNMVESSGLGQILYIDSDTQVSFLVYHMELSCAPYSLSLTVDAQSGQILAFSLRWALGAPPNWGARGAANFGSSWRDYWGMDSVNGGWYNDYIRAILVETESMLQINGEYNSNADLSFSYDGQELRIPLSNWAGSKRGCGIRWNM